VCLYERNISTRLSEIDVYDGASPHTTLHYTTKNAYLG
jgi:hypothetical protein